MGRGIRRAVLGVVGETTAERLVEEKEAKSWEEFEPWLQKIESTHEKLNRPGRDGSSRPLFRGQANSKWKLLTTLERYFRTTLTFAQYAQLIEAAKPFIETLTGRRWDLSPASGALPNAPFFVREEYEYLLYLRHHGFPSPLLDWSVSPYLAAFFAFNEAEDAADGHVSIYGFIQHAEKADAPRTERPQIYVLPRYVRSHQRHFLQQSGYTVCLRENKGTTEYAEHEDVFMQAEAGRDLIWRLNIPISERRRVLRHLDRHNINAYSLFANEEGMTRTIAFREIEAAIERNILPAPEPAKK